MKQPWTLALAAAGALLVVAIAPPARASIIITVEETGGDVVMTGGGTLDLSLWTLGGGESLSPAVNPDSVLTIGAHADVDYYLSPSSFAGPGEIGPGTADFEADSGSGDYIGLGWDLPVLVVPMDFLSGDPLGPSTATYIGHTFASLGLAEGGYTWTWDTSNGQGDSFTININPSPAIPEPATLSLLALGGLGLLRRRRRA